jgi:hypothetical protein
MIPSYSNEPEYAHFVQKEFRAPLVGESNPCIDPNVYLIFLILLLTERAYFITHRAHFVHVARFILANQNTMILVDS